MNIRTRRFARFASLAGVLLVLLGVALFWAWREEPSGRLEARAPAAVPRSTSGAPHPGAAPSEPIYDTSSAKALAASMIAHPPSREKFTALLASFRRSNALFIELGRQDFPVALRLADYSSSAVNARAKAVWGYAEVDPNAALTWALAHPQPGFEVTIGNMYLQSWAAGAFGPQRAALYAFIDRFPEGQETLTPRHDAISGIEHRARVLRTKELYREVFDDPRAPGLLLSLRSSAMVTGGFPDGRLLGLAGDWGRADSADLLAYAAHATNPLTRRALLNAAAGIYVDHEPMAGLEWALGVDPDGRLGVVDSSVRTWINKSGDYEAALRWAREDPARAAHVDAVGGIVAARIGYKDFVRGYEIALTIADEARRHKALEDIARFSRKNEPHYAYVKQSGHAEILWAVAIHHAEKEPARAAELIARMPPGKLRLAAEERMRSAAARR